MPQVSLKISTKPESFPSGTVGGDFVFEVKQSGGAAQMHRSGKPEIVIDLPVGKYSAKAARESASQPGVYLGDSVYTSFEVTANSPVIVEVCESLVATQL